MALGRRTSIDRMNSGLRRKNQIGYNPEEPWWKNVLATIIACVLVILVFAIIFFIGTL